MTEATNAIADKVRGIAAEKRYTQTQIAQTLGISRTSVAERFKGRIAFTASEVFTLSEALNVSVSRFFPDRAHSPLTTPVPDVAPSPGTGVPLSSPVAGDPNTPQPGDRSTS